MSEFNIEVEGGKAVRLPTAGKYCDRDIVVTATGGGPNEEDYNKGYADGRQEEHASIINPNWTRWDEYAKNERPELITCLRYSDTANGVNFESFAHQNSKLYEMPPIDTSNGENFKNMFFFCRGLHTIGELNLSKATKIDGILNWCDGLIHIHFVPGSIHLSLGLAKSNMLDDASIQDIIDGLADLTGQTAQTLTFHADVGAKLTQAQKDAVSAKNWTLVY